MTQTTVATMEVAFGGDPDDKVKLVIETTEQEGQFRLFVDGGMLANGAEQFFGTFNQCMDQLSINSRCAFRGH